MFAYISRRILLAIPVLIGIVVVVFFLIRAIPGEPGKGADGSQGPPPGPSLFTSSGSITVTSAPAGARPGAQALAALGDDPAA